MSRPQQHGRRPVGPQRRPSRPGYSRRRGAARRNRAVVVVVAAAAAATWWATTRATTHAGPTAGAGRPSFAQVEYQVQDAATGVAVTSWEVVTRSGPFDVTDLTYG